MVMIVIAIVMRIVKVTMIYCAQKEMHIFNVAISNELFD